MEEVQLNCFGPEESDQIDHTITSYGAAGGSYLVH